MECAHLLKKQMEQGERPKLFKRHTGRSNTKLIKVGKQTNRLRRNSYERV